MNGAMAELCARTINVPTMKNVSNIGMSHHLLLLQKNENNSRMIPIRPAAVCKALANPITVLLLQVLLRFAYGNSVAGIHFFQ
jgi:hypothetical protein